ncbi:dialkylrecorsinol condensing enzyme DarA [Capnocytophaga sp. G2]|uniref:dialkylrecorsinol condensing enzyme DarA n=1 Tax=Capnocytophaga sp. G2 TaxID=3110695 RepID=UPI002B481409|nr:dialkylrecorsinol condensing enzyme DarA [Capnocytophaga sp. G2]MEB3004514.1 dialkylresorcinol condensing enzyme DarA [Capnocytophaga sp. G2]
MKRILVIYYTQSGQLKEIIDNFARPLRDADIAVDYYRIEMEQEFPFPWTNETFFGVFPESFLQIPQPIKPIPSSILEKNYDLIILAYQVWYLSPSIPINSFLKSKQAKQLLEETPIMTLSGTRNMWIKAQEKINLLINKNKAYLIGNIALTDRNYNHISVITIVHWLFTGKKDKYLGIFPKAGVSQKDIEGATSYGKILLKYLKTGIYNNLQEEIITQGGVQVKSFLLSSEKKGNRLFRIWANIIHQSSHRKLLLKCFHVYLYVAIWIMMPIVWVFYYLTYPFFYRSIRKEVKEVKRIKNSNF